MGGHAVAAVRDGWTHARRLPARRRPRVGHPAGRGRVAAGRHRRARHRRRRRPRPARRGPHPGPAAAEDSLHRPQLHGPLPRAEDRATRSADAVRQVSQQRDRAGRADSLADRLQRAGGLRGRARRRDSAGPRSASPRRTPSRTSSATPPPTTSPRATSTRGDKQWIRGKAADTFCPPGPVVVTTDEIPDSAAAGHRLPRQRRDTAGVAHPRDDFLRWPTSSPSSRAPSPSILET